MDLKMIDKDYVNKLIDVCRGTSLRYSMQGDIFLLFLSMNSKFIFNDLTSFFSRDDTHIHTCSFSLLSHYTQSNKPTVAHFVPNQTSLSPTLPVITS